MSWISPVHQSERGRARSLYKGRHNYHDFDTVPLLYLKQLACLWLVALRADGDIDAANNNSFLLEQTDPECG